MKKVFLLLLSFTIGCAKTSDPTFSLLPGFANFKQNSVLNNRLDILWVVDNSGSMFNLQNNIANNFQSFIQEFVKNGYDFKIGVTTTDAWRAPFVGDPSMAEFKDGDGVTSSGVKVITNDTPNLEDTFLINAKVGIAGHGDERPFQSMKEALESALNSGFRREDAFLAVIIVTDEEDFSHDTITFSGEDYNFPGLHTPDSYKDYLYDLTNSTNTSTRFSVSAISILDNDCLALNNPHGNIATRIQELVDITEGVQGDVCSSNFSQTLFEIQDKIAELSTQFFIERDLWSDTIAVSINGNVISESTENGWSYNETTKVLRFHGDAVPPQGADISIQYEPVTIKD